MLLRSDPSMLIPILVIVGVNAMWFDRLTTNGGKTI